MVIERGIVRMKIFIGNFCILPYQVKTQYLQIIDISIYFRGIKGRMDMFDMVDTAFTYLRALIICIFLASGIFQGKRK